MYNGLQNRMSFFAKFCFIYEHDIKVMMTNGDFKSCFGAAFELYEHKIKCHSRYVKVEEIDIIVEYAQFTLFFTQSKSHVLDFCRHLRNSFNHGILEITSKGYLEHKLVEQFVKEIVNVYEHNN